MKSVWIILGCLSGAIVAEAQTDFEKYRQERLRDFQDYKQQRQLEFEEYRDRINTEFAEYMRQAWTPCRPEPAVPVPDRPEPPRPLVRVPGSVPSSDLLPQEEPVSLPVTPPVAPVPVPLPTVRPEEDVSPRFTFSFYGTPCSVSLDDSQRFELLGVSEENVASAWLQLSSERYVALIHDCLEWRDKLELCDWGYVRFLEKMTETYFPADRQNEARLLQMYLLAQSGYKTRIARTDHKLVLLLPSEVDMYGYSYIPLGGCKYYIIDKEASRSAFHVFDHSFPGETFFSLEIAKSPLLAVEPTVERIFASGHYPEATARVSTNKNLIDFYNEYPISNRWDLYVRSSLSRQAKHDLYPALRRCIQGKDAKEAAGILLDFVQSAFAYQTDNQQFGYERPFFADESLYYPYCDCEDRAILYAVLIRELLGLDVVLLHYPRHLTAAVGFEPSLDEGDYVVYEGRKYTVCDPTYLNARIGESMPEYKKVKARIIPIIPFDERIE